MLECSKVFNNPYAPAGQAGLCIFLLCAPLSELRLIRGPV